MLADHPVAPSARGQGLPPLQLGGEAVGSMHVGGADPLSEGGPHTTGVSSELVSMSASTSVSMSVSMSVSL